MNNNKNNTKMYWVTLSIAVCAVLAIIANFVITWCVYQAQFVPQEKRAEVRFALTQTASMLDKAKIFIEENPGNIFQETAVVESGKEFREGWILYDDDQYDPALDKFKSARSTIYQAFPPENIPSIYYLPFLSYPSEL